MKPINPTDSDPEQANEQEGASLIEVFIALLSLSVAVGTAVYLLLVVIPEQSRKAEYYAAATNSSPKVEALVVDAGGQLQPDVAAFTTARQKLLQTIYANMSFPADVCAVVWRSVGTAACIQTPQDPSQILLLDESTSGSCPAITAVIRDYGASCVKVCQEGVVGVVLREDGTGMTCAVGVVGEFAPALGGPT